MDDSYHPEISSDFHGDDLGFKLTNEPATFKNVLDKILGFYFAHIIKL